jgi:hypothetical protein
MKTKQPYQENNMSKEQKSNQELQIEVLTAKLENLSSKVTKAKTSEEEFQERLAKYEASKPKRDALKADIEKRRMEIWSQNPKMKQEEVILMESWERRAKSIEATDPEFAGKLKGQMKAKVKEVNEDMNR